MHGEPLKIRVFHMKEVRLGDGFKLEADRLTVPQSFNHACDLIEQLKIQVLPPRQHDVETNTIMDVVPGDYPYPDGSICRHVRRYH